MCISDVDYRNFSFEQILSRANDLLFEFHSVNRPLTAQGPRVLPIWSEVAISARPDGLLAFNFASRAVQAMMIDTVPEAESLCEELGRRIAMSYQHAFKGHETLDRLDQEVVRFLDGRRLTGPLDTDEIRDFAIESVRSPLLPAVF